jgi:hypothetical protein
MSDPDLETRFALLKASYKRHAEMCRERGRRLERLVWGLMIVMLAIIGFLAERALK